MQCFASIWGFTEGRWPEIVERNIAVWILLRPTTETMLLLGQCFSFQVVFSLNFFYFLSTTADFHNKRLDIHENLSYQRKTNLLTITFFTRVVRYCTNIFFFFLELKVCILLILSFFYIGIDICKSNSLSLRYKIIWFFAWQYTRCGFQNFYVK